MCGSLVSCVYNYIALLGENPPDLMIGKYWGLEAFLSNTSHLSVYAKYCFIIAYQ